LLASIDGTLKEYNTDYIQLQRTRKVYIVAYFILDRMKAWLKGGIIGSIIAIFSIIFDMLRINCCHFLKIPWYIRNIIYTEPFEGIFYVTQEMMPQGSTYIEPNALALPFSIIISIVIGFLIGAIISILISKIKSKK
jgi:ABC-type antimicrobial peptide transport system permease subunit